MSNLKLNFRILTTNLFLFALLTHTITSCGSSNLFDCGTGYAKSQCTELTKEERARIALDNSQFDTAIELLSETIQEEPTNYHRHPLLAAAYAARSGFDIFNIAKANFGGSSTLIQTMNAFLPTPATKGAAYGKSLADMDSSVNTLKTIPEAQRLATSSDKYAKSAAVQLVLYQAAYGVMLLNKYSYTTTGYDPSQLANMTPEDALAILNSIAGAANTASGGAASEAANKAITAINNQPGTTTQEKIASWSQTAR